MATDSYNEKDVIDLADLVPDPNQVRQHTPRNLGMIVNSLQELGAARSIVIDEDNVVLAGNGVVEAAGQIDLRTVRVVEADGTEIIAVRRRGLTPLEKMRLAVADNRTSELSGWDPDLMEKLPDRQEVLKGFFTEEEISGLLENVGLQSDQFSESEQGVTGLTGDNTGIQAIELLFPSDEQKGVVNAWLKKLRDQFDVESSGMALYEYILANETDEQ